MKKSITFETATLMMDMSFFTMIQIYKSFCYDTEDIVSGSKEMQNYVRKCFESFCEMKGIEEVEE